MQKRGYHFSFKIFCLTVPKNFVREQFGVSDNFGYRNFFCVRRGISRFSLEIFLSHSTEKTRGGTLQCFRKFRVSKNFMHKKGISLFSVETLSHSANKIRGGTLQSFRKFRVSKNFMHMKGISQFFVEIFCLTVPKNSWGNPSRKFWYRKF